MEDSDDHDAIQKAMDKKIAEAASLQEEAIYLAIKKAQKGELDTVFNVIHDQFQKLVQRRGAAPFRVRDRILSAAWKEKIPPAFVGCIIFLYDTLDRGLPAEIVAGCVGQP